MRIITWNINSVRLRINLLKKLQEIQNADVICLQETKTSDELFPIDIVKSMGFEHIVFTGEKSYNGVAIISKFPITESFSLSLYNQDKRHIAAKINDIEIHNFYVPAGGYEPDIDLNYKYRHKLCFINLIKEWFVSSRNAKDKIVLLGDLNIAPHEHDVWSTKQLQNIVSHTALERKALIDLQNSFDFVDSGRYFTSLDKKLYSWWSYRNQDWKKSNRGRRLDHIWVSKPLQPNLKSTFSFFEARDWSKPSDHVPFILNMTFEI